MGRKLEGGQSEREPSSWCCDGACVHASCSTCSGRQRVCSASAPHTQALLGRHVHGLRPTQPRCSARLRQHGLPPHRAPRTAADQPPHHHNHHGSCSVHGPSALPLTLLPTLPLTLRLTLPPTLRLPLPPTWMSSMLLPSSRTMLGPSSLSLQKVKRRWGLVCAASENCRGGWPSQSSIIEPLECVVLILLCIAPSRWFERAAQEVPENRVVFAHSCPSTARAQTRLQTNQTHKRDCQSTRL
jgi:hypothetical protein